MLRLNPDRYPIDELPEVAIVIPCYNYSNFLKDAVESVVAQTYPKIDCVIVDDGSPDDTGIVAESLIELYPERKIRLLSQENAGLAQARTNGVRATQAPLVLPLDQDDLFAPQTVEHMVHFFLEHPDTMVLTPNGRHFDLCLSKITTGAVELSHMLKTNDLVYASMYRREVFDDVDGYNSNMKYGCEDWDFWIALKKRGFKFRHIDEELFFYRRHGTSMIDTANEHSLWVRSRIILNNPELFKEKDVELARCVIDQEDQDPDLNFYLRVVMMLVEIKREQDCIPYCDKLLDKGRHILPDEVVASVLYFKGVGLFAQQDFAAAAHTLRASLDKNPCNPVCLRAYGTALFKSNQEHAAITALEDALELQPGDEQAIFTMALIRARTRKHGAPSTFKADVACIPQENLAKLQLERYSA